MHERDRVRVVQVRLIDSICVTGNAWSLEFESESESEAACGRLFAVRCPLSFVRSNFDLRTSIDPLFVRSFVRSSVSPAHGRRYNDDDDDDSDDDRRLNWLAVGMDTAAARTHPL